jgi:hypothetical protein
MAKSANELSFLAILGISVAVVACYLLACFLPCVDCGYPESFGDLDFGVYERGRQYGLSIFLFWWVSDSKYGIPWTANVFLLFGMLSLWRQRVQGAMVSGTIASVLGLTTWWVTVDPIV